MWETFVNYNDGTDREGRNIKLSVKKGSTECALPLLNEKELRNLAEKIYEFLG